MFEEYTKQAEAALALARQASEQLRQNYIGSEHLLIGLIRENTGVAAKVLLMNKVTAENIRLLTEQLVAPGADMNTSVAEREGLTPRASRILSLAGDTARNFNARAIGTEHILIAILREGDNTAVRLMNTMGVSIQKVFDDTVTAMGFGQGNLPDRVMRPLESDDGESSTPMLDKYSRDMTRLAREDKLDPIIGRDTEIMRTIQILSRRTKNNACLLGEPGVGKTAIVEGLAIQIAEGKSIKRWFDYM